MRDTFDRVAAAAVVDVPTLALPFVLSVIAGSTDVIGFLGLNGLLTSHITGNLVILAGHVIAGNTAILSHVLSLPVFMLVLLVVSLFASHLKRIGRAPLRPLLSVQLLLLLAFLVLCVWRREPLDTDSALAVVAGMCGVAAMAVQTATVQVSLTDSPSTAVMTTNVSLFILSVSDLLRADDATAVAKARKRAIHVLPVIVGFALGCALGAAGQAAYGLWSLGLPTALALLAVAMAWTVHREKGE